MFGNGAISSGFPIFFEPIRRDLGISYASMSLVFSLARAEGGMGGPHRGLDGGPFRLTSHDFLRRADCGGRAYPGFPGPTGYWQLALIFVGIVSTGKTAGLGQTLMATVNQWFIRRKALAMSTLMTAFAGGGAIVVPLLHLGIANLGWRDTLLWVGIFVCALTIPVCLVLRSRPEDMGLRPDGDAAPSASPGQARAARRDARDFTVREALVTATFWLMLLGVVARVSATNAIIIHIFPMLEGEGLKPSEASLYVSAMFFLAIPLRFVMGVAGGMLSPRKILFGGLNIGALGLLALLLMDGHAGAIIFVLALAVVEGVSSVNWIMLGDYFGRSRFASLMGFDERVPQRRPVRLPHIQRLGQGHHRRLQRRPDCLHPSVRRQRNPVRPGRQTPAANSAGTVPAQFVKLHVLRG